MRDGRGDGLDGVGDLAVHDVGERRRRALVRDVARLDLRHRVEQLGDHVRVAPVPEEENAYLSGSRARAR